MRRGFTLVELSIVFVIIGLLIGGILVAQSMINTAQIEGAVRQLTQYEVAISNFKTKYNQLPGDSNLFDNPGNNDGIVDINFASAGESGNFWSHLSLGVNLKNRYGNDFQSFALDTDIIDETKCPRFDLKQNNTEAICLLPMYVSTYFWPGGPSGEYFYYFSPSDSKVDADRVNSNYDPLTVPDALAIDTKIDDGKPFSGSVGATHSGTTPGGCISTSPNKYLTANPGYICTMYIHMGVTNGSL